MFDDFIAILPEQIKGKGICARLYTRTDSVLDDRSPTLFLKNMYDQRGRHKKKIDKLIRERFQIKRNIPYVIDSRMVFFAFKYRKSSYDKQTRGFVNVKYVERIVGSNILLKTGEIIETLSSEKSLIYNRILAQALLAEELLIVMRDNDEAIRYVVGRIRERA